MQRVRCLGLLHQLQPRWLRRQTLPGPCEPAHFRHLLVQLMGKTLPQLPRAQPHQPAVCCVCGACRLEPHCCTARPDVKSLVLKPVRHASQRPVHHLCELQSCAVTSVKLRGHNRSKKRLGQKSSADRVASSQPRGVTDSRPPRHTLRLITVDYCKVTTKLHNIKCKMKSSCCHVNFKRAVKNIITRVIT